MISAKRDPLVILSAPEKDLTNSVPFLGDVRIGDNDGNAGPACLPHGRDHGLAIGGQI